MAKKTSSPRPPRPAGPGGSIASDLAGRHVYGDGSSDPYPDWRGGKEKRFEPGSSRQKGEESFKKYANSLGKKAGRAAGAVGRVSSAVNMVLPRETYEEGMEKAKDVYMPRQKRVKPKRSPA